MILTYSSIAGAPRTVSMGFDLPKIIQSQGLRHSLYFQFRGMKISRGGFFRESSPSICVLVPGQLRSAAGLKTEKLFQICSKGSRHISGCPLKVGSEGSNPITDPVSGWLQLKNSIPRRHCDRYHKRAQSSSPAYASTSLCNAFN